MKILVVSHTPHYLKDGQAFGWGPTVREIDALATIAAELVHVAPMHNEPAPDCALAYRMRNVRLHPVPASGGATLTAKFGVGRALPAYVRAIASELRDADIVHVRCPAHVSMVALVMLEALGRSRRQWIKYAGTWAPDAHSPRSYRFQRWLSTRPRHDRVVTINGRWADQPSHVRSLPNPCLTDEELDTGRRLARDKALAGPVRLLFVGALIPPKGAAMLPGDTVPLGTKVGLMLLMYALGTGGAFGFAWLFKKHLLKGEPPLMIMELPPYRLPRLKDVVLHMLERAGLFLRRAGTIILAISIVLWFLTTFPKHSGDATAQEQIAHSFAGTAGRVLEPVIKPLGFDWRVGIGLVSSFAAREVFVSSMGVVFGVESADQNVTPLRAALRQAQWPDGAPLFTPLVCFTLMIFYVFAMQCMSTVAVVKRETNSWRWPLFQTAYMTGTAWLVCLIVFQAGRALGFD